MFYRVSVLGLLCIRARLQSCRYDLEMIRTLAPASFLSRQVRVTVGIYFADSANPSLHGILLDMFTKIEEALLI